MGLPCQAARGATMLFSTSLVRSSATQLTTDSGLHEHSFAHLPVSLHAYANVHTCQHALTYCAHQPCSSPRTAACTNSSCASACVSGHAYVHTCIAMQHSTDKRKSLHIPGQTSKESWLYFHALHSCVVNVVCMCHKHICALAKPAVCTHMRTMHSTSRSSHASFCQDRPAGTWSGAWVQQLISTSKRQALTFTGVTV
eukprot:788055-Pelagomonas_calceolata.AAC.1